jgi:hypothetical protein
MEMSDSSGLHPNTLVLATQRDEDERFSSFLQSIVMDFGYVAGNEAATAGDTQILQFEVEEYGYIVDWECLTE